MRQAPRLTLALFLVPIAAGLLGTLLPALGWFPPIGGERLSLGPFRDLFAEPAFPGAWQLTIWSGWAATLLSVALTLGCCALLYARPIGRPIRALITPVLAAPHAAMAIGFAFLIAPSGWIARWVSRGLTGWLEPPAIASVQDPHGIALILGLIVKEVPYLLLMSLTALRQLPVARQLDIAATLGYGRTATWVKVVLPQLYPQIRLPIYVVLAYGLSVVDMALILGPDNPPTLSVLTLQWLTAPDVRLYFRGAAAALLLLGVVLASILVWRLGELALAQVGRCWITLGQRRSGFELPAALTGVTVGIMTGLALTALLDLTLWSFAVRWRFPDVLPSAWTLSTWHREADAVTWSLGSTLLVAFGATALALALVLVWLESEPTARMGRASRASWLVYLPLLVPQIAFLFGIQVLLALLHVDGTYSAVVAAHLLFVLPYVFLSLADPWRALDARYMRTALCLGATPWRVLWRVKIPMLQRPVLVAAAIGLTVSFDQYLPTIFAGAGRVSTLATQVVTLSSGGDRRVVGVFALLLAALPLAAYGLAAGMPAVLARRHRKSDLVV
ncbi:MAG: ABC transporter permease [Proteobacteria bacterium]|nr:ABC transporter permease [Pseudomonadota bacterium]